MLHIPASTYTIGANSPLGFLTDLESPLTSVTSPGFFISPTTVTNQEFQLFVQETGYQTLAQQVGWSLVFHLQVLDKKYSNPLNSSPWWHQVPGADWAHPYGPSSSLSDILDHPVVHVALEDAVAYCNWLGHRLPTEAEWEIAAKGGTSNSQFPWGDDKGHLLASLANTWQGDFPYVNTQEDGFIGTAPVHAFPPNGYQIYQMIGNVWEWTCNPSKIEYENFSYFSSDDFWSTINHPKKNHFAIKGGSFLCHDSYCRRYRISARNSSHIQTTASNLGFRTVKSN